MRAPARYRELEDAIAAGRRLTVAELRDLQVLSTLVWTGATARRDHPVLAELVAKGRDFSPAYKGALLSTQREVLAGFPELLRRFARADGPSLSTSPLHHPILPLLVNVRHAGRNLATPPDVEFAFPTQSIHLVKPEDLEHADVPADATAGEELGRAAGKRIVEEGLARYGGSKPPPVVID